MDSILSTRLHVGLQREGPTPLSNTQGGDKQGKSGQEENNFYFSFLTDAWWSVKMLILLPNT